MIKHTHVVKISDDLSQEFAVLCELAMAQDTSLTKATLRNLSQSSIPSFMRDTNFVDSVHWSESTSSSRLEGILLKAWGHQRAGYRISITYRVNTIETTISEPELISTIRWISYIISIPLFFMLWWWLLLISVHHMTAYFNSPRVARYVSEKLLQELRH